MHRLGSLTLDIATPSGVVLARHRLAPDGAAAVIRDTSHVTALNTAVLAAFTTDAPHRRKQRIPPSPAALAAAEALRPSANSTGEHARTVIDLATYAAAAAGRTTLT